MGFHFSLKSINSWLNLMAIAAFVISSIVTISDITGRYLLGVSFPGSFEIASMAMAFIVYGSMPYAQMKGSHIRIDMLTQRLPRGVRVSADLFALFLGMCFWSAMAWFLGIWTLESWRSRKFSAGELPFAIYPIKFAATFGSAIFALEFLLEIVQILSDVLGKKRRGERPS
jgi:TRAP-type transport system small permease protein